MLICASSGPLQPLLCRKRATTRVLRPTVSLSTPWRRLSGRAQPIGAQSVHLVRAQHDESGPVQKPHEPRKAHAGAVAARQLLSVTALAFFTLLATVVKDRATSPIIPPLIPTLLDTTSNDGGLSSKPQIATATAEIPTEEASSASKAAVKPSRSLLRALWGTATAPVKLVDSLLFPEEALVGSKQDNSAAVADSASAAQPAPAAAKQPKQGRKAAAAAAAGQDSLSSAVPAADPAAAAAGQALAGLSQQVDALTAAFPEVPASSPASSTAPDFLVQLQEAVARMVSQQQGSAQGTAERADTNTAAVLDADAAAVLAVLRMMIGPDAMSLLPVLLVTSATAAAGLMMAASIAGVAGLVDKRRALTPAQRAAQAALLDSPLRPITCQTWPGFLPMLPSSIEPNYYRFRDSDTPAAAGNASIGSGGASSAVSSGSKGSGAAAAASAAGPGPKEHPLDQEWWSFAQIQALRLMPLLPSSSGSSNVSSGASSSSMRSSSSSAAPVAAAAAGAAAAGTAAAATTAGAAAAATAKAQPAAAPAKNFADVKKGLHMAANTILFNKKGDRWNHRLFGIMHNDADGAILLGEAWQLAVDLAAVDTLESPDIAWDVVHSFGATAPTGLLAEVCALIPGAVVAVRDATSKYDADWDSGSMSGWEQASLLICMLLDPATNGLGRVQEVCEAMGIVGTAAAPDVLHGVLQQHCQRLVRETVQLEAVSDLTFGTAVPEARQWLQAGKRQRVAFAAAALNSSIMAAYTVAELWGEAVGEKVAGLAAPDAAGAAGVSWEQPRAMLQHVELLQVVLCEVLPDYSEALSPLAVDLLDISTPALRQGKDGHPHRAACLLDSQDAPPNGLGYQASGSEASAAAAMHKQIHAAASQPALFDDALRPVFNGSAGLGEDDAALFEKGEIEFRVIDALVASLLVVKLPQTALPFSLRPEWPAAQQLALIDSMLLPSMSKYLQDNFAPEDNSVDGSISEFVARTLVLLPAAVVSLRSFLDQEAAGDAQRVRSSLCASRESASAVCLRMYNRILSGICEARDNEDNIMAGVMSALGLSPAAVTAAVDAAIYHGKGVDVAADAAVAAAAAAGQYVAEQASLGTGSLLTEVSEEYAFWEAEHDRAFNECVMTSFAVCLPLLLQLCEDNCWPILAADASDADAEQCQDARPGWGWAALPPLFWAFTARCFSESGAAQLPGGAAAAALLRASLTQAQQWAEENHEQYPECEALSQEDYALACERLCASSSGSSSRSSSDGGGSSSSSGAGDVPAPWEAAMAAALVLPEGLDLDGDEQWREREDYRAAVEEGSLWWLEHDSSDSSSEGEEGEQDSDAAAEMLCSRDGEGSGDWDADVQQEGEEEEEEASYADRDWEQEGYESDLEGEMDADSEEPDYDPPHQDPDYDPPHQDPDYDPPPEEYNYGGYDSSGGYSRSSVPHASAHASCGSVSDGEGDGVPTATESEACEQFYEMLFDVIVGAPDEIEIGVKQLEDAGAGLGKAWGLAVYAAYALHQECVVGKGTPAEGSVAHTLRQFASAAPARLVAEMCALLPAAVVNYEAFRVAAAAAAGVSAGKDAEGDSSSSGSKSWESAAYLINALLTPTSANAAAAEGDDAASWVRRVCWELGLYWHGSKESSKELKGVLQSWATEVSAMAATREQLGGMKWGPAAASQALRQRAEANQKLDCELASMGLCSTFMAAYMAMEVWYSRDSPFMPDSLDYEERRRSANAAAPDARYPAVLFSHYAMLQHLTDSSESRLSQLVTTASELAADPSYREQKDDCTWDGDDDTWDQHCAHERYLRGLQPYLALLVRNSAGCGQTELKGKLPDVNEFESVLQCLQQVQGAMHGLLCVSQQTLEAAEQQGAVSEQQLVSDLAEAVICGEEVVPVHAKASVHGLLAIMPEWRAGAQLVELEARCATYVSGGAAEQLLQQFAAEVDDRVLARVCALLPAVAHTERRDEESARVAAWVNILTTLTAGAQDATVAGELLRHLGLQPAAAAAAATAARGAVPNARIDAAIAAITDSSMPVECPGFLQEAWRWRSELDSLSGAAEAAATVARSVLVAAAQLLGGLSQLPAAADARVPAAAASTSHKPEDLLPLEGWRMLVQEFSALPCSSITGKAAAAGLVYHGLLAAQAREETKQQPAALQAVLKHTLHKRAGPESMHDYEMDRLLNIDGWSARGSSKAFVPEHPVPLARRPGSEGAVAAEAAAVAASASAQVSPRQPGSPASSTAAAAESSTDSDDSEQQSGQQHGEEGKDQDRGAQDSSSSSSSSGDDMFNTEVMSQFWGWPEHSAWSAAAAAAAGVYRGSDDDDMPVGKYKSIKSSAFSAASSSSSSGPSVADIREYGWSEGWGVPGEGEVGAGEGSAGKQKGKKKRKQNKNKQNKTAQKQGEQGGAAAAAAAASDSSTVKETQQQQQKKKGESAVPKTNGISSGAGQSAGAVKVTVEKGAAPAAAGQAGQAADQDKEGGGASESEVIPTVKKLLGLPVDPADSLSTGDVVPNRLALLMCQAMLMRGDDAREKLQAAVGFLAVAKSGQALQLPAMLSNCMEALFTTEDWESPTGSACQVLSSLSDALPWQSYMSLQKHLMAKELIKELEVPAEFE